MTQETTWDREYQKSKLLTKDNKPQTDVVRFVQYLKEQNFSVEGSTVLDLGSGAGRNSYYFAELGASVTGIEFSKTAVKIANDNLANTNLNVKYIKQSIGEKFPLEDKSIDIILDITSSNSLNESEREVCLSEMNRVMKNDGIIFVKALCKDGDSNAKYLLKNFPGKERDTYIMPDLGVVERVWSKEDFTNTYKKYFNIISMQKKTSYSRMNNRVYKRNFWIVYMGK